MHYLPRPQDISQIDRLHAWVEDSNFGSVSFGVLDSAHPEILVSRATIGSDTLEVWFGPRVGDEHEGRWCKVNAVVYPIETDPRDMGIGADAIRGLDKYGVRDHLRLLLFIHVTMEPFFRAQGLAGRPVEMMLQSFDAVAALAIEARDDRGVGSWHPES